VTKLNEGEGCGTILTTAIGRIIDQVVVLNQGETALIVTGLGRGEAVEGLLRRNIFWNDRLGVENVSDGLGQIGILGDVARKIVGEIWSGAEDLARYHFIEGDDGCVVVRVPSLASGDGYWVIGEPDGLEDIKDEMASRGILEATLGVYEALRIEAGLPEVGHELTEDFIPLELGLWDMVSFNKGCYVGQEVIARMESRGKLAKMLVWVELDEIVAAGTGLATREGKSVGSVTSVAEIPAEAGASKNDGSRFIGLAVVKPDAAETGTQLVVKDEANVSVEVVAVAGNYQAVYD